jgi:hypothetical protein
MKNLEKIKQEDPEMYDTLLGVVDYLASTYEGKYSASPFDTRSMLYHPKHGKSANMFTAMKYLGRYCTEGFDKSENVVDIKKAIHYCLFELVRRSKKETFSSFKVVPSNNESGYEKISLINK